MPTVYACEGFELVGSAGDVVQSLNSQLGSVNTAYTGSFTSVIGPYGVTRQVAFIPGNKYFFIPFDAAPSVFCVSAQLNIDIVATGTIIAAYDGATQQCYLRLEPAGGSLVLKAYRGDGTLLGTESGSILINTWHQYSIKLTIGNSGAISVYRDGSSVLDLSGVDTQNSASAQVTQARFSPSGNGFNTAMCDLVISDDRYTNQVRVLTLSPNADGDDTAWTASAGSRYACLDDLPRSATDYIYSATVGNENSIKVPALSVSGTILTVVDQIFSRKSDVDARSIKQFVKSGGSKSYGSAIALSGTDTIYARKMDTNPVSASAWTSSDFGASGAQFGVKVES